MNVSFHSLTPEEENHMLKLELQAKTSELQKLKAVSEQQSFFLKQQLEEVKARETNIKSMNETIMQVLQDITNSNTKISTELQLKQFLEDHIKKLSMAKGGSNVNEEDLRKAKLEIERIKGVYEERIEDLYKEKENFSFRIHSLEEEKTRLMIDLQNAKLSNKGIYDKLRMEYEKEIAKIRAEMEEMQSRNGDKCSLELMKSQIKEITTQHLIETNSLKGILNETRAKLERVYEAYCELKEKNSQMKAAIQGFRNKEARLKDLLFDRPQQDTEDEDFGLNFDVSYSNNMSLRTKTVHQKRQLEYSSITNILDAFSSQDFMRISPEIEIQREKSPPKTDRIEQREQIKTCLEYIKKRSLSQQLELKPEEFSKPFELEQMEQREKMEKLERVKVLKEEDSNKKDNNNDSMDEFRNKKERGVSDYSDFMNRTKKSMKSLI